ncbi:MAG: outer membrane beta-barrel protein [Ginsengibacter sp.]
MRCIFYFIPGYAQNNSTAVSSLPTITGSIDIYYRYNFDDPKPQGQAHDYNNYSSFSKFQNSFQLGMASIRADQSFGKATTTVDLGFGPRAEEFSYGDSAHPTLFGIKQACLSYKVSNKLKLSAGES